MVNLLGRFRNAAVLELGADGATGGRCVTELPATAAATDVTDEAEPAEEADHE